MANIGTLLKDEITRLARKETKAQLETLRQASSRYRTDIAALKREVADLRRQLALASKPPKAEEAPVESAKLRFQAKGLKSHRQKLGLSAGEYGQLAGVSGQSIYNWEAGKATPRQSQVQALAALRGLGKREAAQRLAAMAG